jgi:2-dehydropantoate 2-reductase
VNAPHWHVLGAGAVGCLFASTLARGGCQTTLLMRDPGARGKRRVVVESAAGAAAVQLAVQAAGAGGAIGHLLVTTKAYDVAAAVAAVAHRLDASSQVLLLANGMGFAAELQAERPHLQLFQGTTTHGAHRIAPLHVRHAGGGATRVGRPGAGAPAAWFAGWARAVPDSHWEPEIGRALWLKLAVNCAINPLTALHRCRNGELASRPALAAEVRLLCEEIAAVSAAAGHVETARTLCGNVAQVLAATAANRSSMLQDVLAGRRTEIDYITGHLLAIAADRGIPAPHNLALLERVRALERRYAPPATPRDQD